MTLKVFWFAENINKMTRGTGRNSRSSPAAMAAAEAQKNREDDQRIKNLLEDYSCIVQEKVIIHR